jgi:hypothetical protein
MSVTPQYPTLHDEIARQILQLRDRVYRLLRRIGTEGRCSCGAHIVRVTDKDGGVWILELDAKPHSCPQATPEG